MKGPESNEQEWSARIEAAGPGPYDVDWASDILDRLEGRGPVMSVGQREVGVRFNVWAPDVRAAAVEALNVFDEVLPDLRPVEVEVIAVEEQERQLQESNVPDLLGVAEIADALGVSKQRVSELAAQESFPVPIARLRSGPVWQRSALARFMSSWNRRPGRRPAGHT